MAKQILFYGWVSIVPDQMIKDWVKAKYLPHTKIREIRECLEPKDRATKDIAYVKEADYNVMHDQVGKWYDEVMAYVTNWLKEKGFIKLVKGNFRGGFCATEHEDETTKNWGAPLAAPDNRVIQIKEKFGQIRVYFTGLSAEEKVEVEKFRKHVEKKFDCSCVAWG